MRRSAAHRATALLALAIVLGASIASAEDVPAREQLAMQLQEQLAANEALRARIQELERLLATDVCVAVPAAEALLEKAAPTPPVAD